MTDNNCEARKSKFQISPIKGDVSVEHTSLSASNHVSAHVGHKIHPPSGSQAAENCQYFTHVPFKNRISLVPRILKFTRSKAGVPAKIIVWHVLKERMKIFWIKKLKTSEAILGENNDVC